MRLPKDRAEWHSGHLRRAEAALERAFDRYERVYDADQPEASAYLFGDVLRKEALVADIATVVG